MDNFRMPLIGEKAPDFKANSTYGPVNFPADYKGKWVVFFSHPGDFTPVCTTEMMTFASMKDQFTAKNAALLGLSVDSNPSHIAWVKAMGSYSWNGINNPQVSFPIIADDFGNIARMYGMLMPSASATKTVRNVYMIDPAGMVRAMLVYPLTTGRNMKEIYRLLLALQVYDQNGYATPADWQPGEDQLYAAPQTMPMAAQRLDGQAAGGYNCLDWYLCFTKAGGNQSNMPMPMPKPMPLLMPAMPATSVHNARILSGIPVVAKLAKPAMPALAAEQAALNANANMNTNVNNNTIMNADMNMPLPLPGDPIYDVPQPGRPFAPEFVMMGDAGMQGMNNPVSAQPKNNPVSAQPKNNPVPMRPARNAASIIDENRNMLGKNKAQGNMSSSYFGDYLLACDNQPKKNM